ncbi:MAG: hypothetical protein ACRDC6_18630, partial [Shewanella sp.]
MSFGNRIGRSISSIGAEHHQHCRQDGAIVPQSAHDYQRSHLPSGAAVYITNRKKSTVILFLALKKEKRGERLIYDRVDRGLGLAGKRIIVWYER